MADRFPLIANTSSNQIQELSASDNLDLTGNSIIGVSTIGVSTVTATSSIVGSAVTMSESGVDVTGIVTSTSFSGSAASLTLIPAANIVGLATAGFERTGGFGGGSLEFVKKVEPSSAVSSIVETGLDYDTVYRLVFANLSLSAYGGVRLSPHIDNYSTPHNNSDCNQGYTNANGLSNGQTGQNHWNMYPAIDRTYNSAIWELYTGDRAWMFWRYYTWNVSSDYTGWVQGYGWKVVASNTNNDPNNTGSFAKVNGFTIADIYGNNINPGTKLLIYKYKES